ncbi:MAG: pilus assembly protein [Afipia sp.]|nr:pilus assembly protein [Afipia sp.]
MERMISVSKLAALMRHFRLATKGNVAVIFAIAIVPIIGFIGAAVDYSRVNNARTAMQSALDSAALMISKDAAGLTAAQITSRAQGYFNALYNHPEIGSVTVSATYSANTGTGAQIVMNGSGTMPTAFMKVAGYPSIDFGVSSTTKWGSTKMRVAMALDNTGSMASAGKMPALQTAAKNLIDQLSATAVADGDVLISIIPFATAVNIGTGFKNQPWMDWSQWADDGSIENGWTCSTRNRSRSQEMICGSAANNINNWNGCVMDRAQPYDVQADAPATATTGTWLAADQSAWCPTQMMPLSSTWQALKDKVDAMSPSGATNQPIGLQWAWFSLNTGLPLNAPAKTVNVTYTDAIILMSDGLNTMDRWYGDGYNVSTQVDDRQALLCAAIKAAGVKIYTIQVNTDGDPESAILKSCASDNQFFSTTTASGIASAFDAIGASLSKLRVAK